jgi:hypothetical protein
MYLSSILTDAEKAVVQTMTMKLLPTPAVQYLNVQCHGNNVVFGIWDLTQDM